MPLPKRLTRAHVRALGKQVLEGGPLQYNISEQMEYVRALKSLVKSVATQVEKEVVALFGTPDAKEFYEQQEAAAVGDDSISSQARILTNALIEKYMRVFALRSRKLAVAMIRRTDKTSQRSLKTSLEKLSANVTIKTNFKTNGLSEILNASVVENVSLIKKIGAKYLSSVQEQVMRSITTGNGLKDLIPALKTFYQDAGRHSKFVALDQTRKVYNQMNRERSQALGSLTFKWRHSGGGQHPRKSHQRLDGQIFKYSDPPVINQERVDNGKAPERGFPGQAPGCKCIIIPVLDFTFGGGK